MKKCKRQRPPRKPVKVCRGERFHLWKRWLKRCDVVLVENLFAKPHASYRAIDKHSAADFIRQRASRVFVVYERQPDNTLLIEFSIPVFT